MCGLIPQDQLLRDHAVHIRDQLVCVCVCVHLCVPVRVHVHVCVWAKVISSECVMGRGEFLVRYHSYSTSIYL